MKYLILIVIMFLLSGCCYQPAVVHRYSANAISSMFIEVVNTCAQVGRLALIKHVNLQEGYILYQCVK